MRVVLDTSVLVAALLSKSGASARLMELWLDEDRFEVLTSDELLAELRQVLARPKFSPRLQAEDLEALDLTLRQASTLVSPPSMKDLRMPDPGDRFIAELALAGDADVVVTLDGELLDMGGVKQGERSVPIVSPGSLLKMIEREEKS